MGHWSYLSAARTGSKRGKQGGVAGLWAGSVLAEIPTASLCPGWRTGLVNPCFRSQAARLQTVPG